MLLYTEVALSCCAAVIEYRDGCTIMFIIRLDKRKYLLAIRTTVWIFHHDDCSKASYVYSQVVFYDGICSEDDDTIL